MTALPLSYPERIRMETRDPIRERETPAPRCSRGWGARCADAKGHTCRCACGGHNHGRSNPLSATNLPSRRKPKRRSQLDMFNKLDARTDRDALFYPMGAPPDRVSLDELRQSDARVIRFRRDDREEPSITVGDGGRVTPLDQTIVYHSPTGLEFGYGGSGPADTALNILALVLTPREAVRLHQHFKSSELSRIPRVGGEMAMQDVRAWIVGFYESEFADTEKMGEEAEFRALMAQAGDESEVWSTSDDRLS